MSHRRNQIIVLMCAGLIVSSGCASQKVSLPYFTNTFARGHFTSARSIAVGQIGGYNSPKDLLWNLQAGSTERLLNNHEESNRYFDRAEDYFRNMDVRSLGVRSWQASQSFLYNESVLPYSGQHHDRIMVNTYKALNFAAMGNFINARVEFNRALARQSDAKAYFAAETEALKSHINLQKLEQRDNSNALERTLDNPQLDKIINERYKNLDNIGAYADFVNPFTTYAAGLFFWLEGKTPSKGIDFLKEAHAMNKNNTFVAQDLARATRGDRPENEVWVIYENGLAPGREEVRLDIPLFYAGTNINYISIAFPNLTPGQSAHDSLSVSSQDGTGVPTQILADMETVIAQEFKKELPNRTAREVTRMAVKAYMQYELNREFGTWASIVGSFYQLLTTGADTRSWTALPKNFQLAHIPIPNDRRVTITAANGTELSIKIPPTVRNMIIYVRAVSVTGEPAFDLIEFN